METPCAVQLALDTPPVAAAVARDARLARAVRVGLVPVTVVAGLWMLGRKGLLLGLLVAGSLLVINAVRYEHSWDIQKFGTVTAIGLSIAASAAIAKLTAPRARVGLRLLGWTLFALAVLPGAAWTYGVSARIEGLPRGLTIEPIVLPPKELEAAAIVREHAGPGEAVYRSDSWLSRGYSQVAGLPHAWPDGASITHGFPERLYRRRYAVLRLLPEDPDMYLRERLRWLVLGPEDRRLVEHLSRWKRRGRARIVGRAGPLVVVELVPRPRPSQW